MMSIDRLSSVPSSGGVTAAAAGSAQAEASAAIGEIGHRVLAWVGETAGGRDQGAAAWAGTTGSQSDFRPSAAELSRGGDVYDLGGLARDIAGRLGGTPAQEGALHRALADFTRASAVQLAGLSGASGERQVAGLRDALATSADTPSGDDIDGVIGRIEAATASLNRQNGL